MISVCPSIKILIPENLKPALPYLFSISDRSGLVCGYMACVIESGKSWVELATIAVTANVKFSVDSNGPIKLFQGGWVHFDDKGNLLQEPMLTRSRKPANTLRKPLTPTRIKDTGVKLSRSRAGQYF